MAITNATRRGRPTPEAARQKLFGVLAAAREEFASRGYRAATMRGVAERANVSTRTLYNHYKDKVSLFTACLDVGAVRFPVIAVDETAIPAVVLRRYAAELVETLTSDSSLRLGMLVYREGAEFPELVAAAEANQDRFLVKPLAAFLARNGLDGDNAEERARLFNTLATSQWQRFAVFGHAMPTREEMERHAAMAVDVFLNGVAVDRESMWTRVTTGPDDPAGSDARFAPGAT